MLAATMKARDMCSNDAQMFDELSIPKDEEATSHIIHFTKKTDFGNEQTTICSCKLPSRIKAISEVLEIDAISELTAHATIRIEWGNLLKNKRTMFHEMLARIIGIPLPPMQIVQLDACTKELISDGSSTECLEELLKKFIKNFTNSKYCGEFDSEVYKLNEGCSSVVAKRIVKGDGRGVECLKETFDVYLEACGVKHVVLGTRQSEIFRWDEEVGGRLDHDVGKKVIQPRLVESLTVTSVDFSACGEFHTYTIIMVRKLYIWGDETHNAGLLGHSFDIDHWLPKRILGSLAGLQIALITCGPWHTTWIMSTEQLLIFRDDTFGFLSHGDRENVTYFASGLSTIVMACGRWHTAAIVEVIVSQSSASISSRKLVTWGDGDKNRFGHGDVEDRKTHTLVEGLKDRHVNYMAYGSNYSVAILHSNNVVHDSERDCYWPVEATTATILQTIRGQNKQEPIAELDASLLFANIQKRHIDFKKKCSEVLKQSIQTTLEACHGFHNIQLHSTSVNFAEIFTASDWLPVTEVSTDELLEWTRLFPTEATWEEYKVLSFHIFKTDPWGQVSTAGEGIVMTTD
ncbi:hypothetical protein GQ457_17G012970 [Hibiscus cannabinus]